MKRSQIATFVKIDRQPPMSNTVFKYALVARGSVPLAEFPRNSTDIHEKSMKILSKLDPSAPFSVVEQQNLVFTASTTKDGLSFVCLCDKSVETRRVGQFLSALKSKWMQTYGPASADFQQGEKDSEFGPQMQELLNHYNELVPPPPPEEEPQRDPESLEVVEERDETPKNPFALDVIADDEHQPGLPPGFEQDREGSLVGLKIRIWWGRHKWHVLIVLGLIVWVYIVLAFYCQDATLVKCFS